MVFMNLFCCIDIGKLGYMKLVDLMEVLLIVYLILSKL